MDKVKMAVEESLSDQVKEALAAQREPLVAQCHRTLRATLFTNRSEVRPAMLRRIAADEAEALLGFFDAPQTPVAIERGRQLCQVGLSEEAVLRLGQTARHFCLTRLPQELRLPALETVEVYHSGLLQGFVQAYKAITLEEQERIRSALQRTLNRYTVQMEVAADVARATTSILDLDELLQTTVDLIRQRFDLDYVAIFLVDESGHWAVLRAATGQVGQEMLKQRLRLEVGGGSMIGWAVAQGEPRVALDVGKESAHFEISPLPDIHSEAVVPLILHGAAIGAMAVQSRRVAAFSDQDVTILSVMADQLASAIENARLFRERERRITELATLNETGRTLSSALELDQLQEAVYRQVSHLFGTRNFYIALYDEQRDEWGTDFYVKGGRQLDPIRHGAEAGLTGHIIRHRQPLLLPTQLKSIAFHETMGIEPLTEPAKSWMGVPLIAADKIVGVMSIQSYEQEELYGEQDLALFSTMAAQVAIAIDNARLFAEIRRFTEELEEMVAARTRQLQAEKGRLETLHAITTELTSTLDLDEILVKTLDLASRTTGGSFGMILLHDPDSEHLVCRATFEEGKSLQACWQIIPLVDTKTFYRVMQDRESLHIADVSTSSLARRLSFLPDRVRSFIAVPLVSAEKVVGVMLLTNSQPGFFDADQTRLLMTLGGEVATAIINAELYGQVNEQARRLTDMLTYQQQEATRVEAILQSIADGVIVVNWENYVVLVNPAAERILGILREDLAGRSTADFPDLFGQDGLFFQENRRFELAGRFIDTHYAPVVLGEEVLGSVYVMRDVTREVAANRAKSEFVSTVSHELRTPLTAIRGYVDLLETIDEVSDTQRQFIGVVQSNISRLADLINDLTDISRIEAGQIDICLEPVSISDLIEEIVQSARIEIERKRLRLETNVPPDLPPVRADRRRILQVLNNLVSNAYKYTLEGGQVTVAAHLVDERLRVDVRDTGVGISEEDQQKLFTRFFRANNRLRDEVGGTGLGLVISKTLVELHGGQMWVESVLEVGSTFSFTLPLSGAAGELAGELGEPACPVDPT